MRIDSHAHIVPSGYRQEVDARGLSSQPLPGWSGELFSSYMDDYAIDAAVLSLSQPGVFFGDAGLAVELARSVNEEIAAVVRSDNSRFAGHGVLPLPDVEAARAEIAYALDVLELDGISLLSNIGGVYPGDESFAPVFDELNRRSAYVFLHPAKAVGPSPLAKYPPWMYEFPFDTTRAVTDLIYSGTLERCPDIRFQIPHLGGTVLALGSRIGSLSDRAPEQAAKAPAGALAYLSRLYYDTGLSNAAELVREANTKVAFDHIVFGSDWPFAALPGHGDPAPALDPLGADRRAELDGSHIGALIPRWANRAG